MTRLQKLAKQRAEAISYIKSILEKRGNEYQLINPDDIQKDDEGFETFSEDFYDLPAETYFDKYNCADECHITLLDLDGNCLTFTGVIGYGDDSGRDIVFPEESMSTPTLMEIADLVEKLEN